MSKTTIPGEQLVAIEGIDALKGDEPQDFDVQKEADELIEILDEMEKIKEMPNPPEKFYPINRVARRNADKRNRALKKRKPRE